MRNAIVQFAKTLVKKWQADNVGMLASVIAWNTLTSMVPIVVGLLAIAGLLLAGNPDAQSQVESHLSAALAGVLTPKDLVQLVHASIHHTGFLAIVGFLGVLWGGANVGGAMSTAFQAIFEVKGRNFIKEKLLDIVMIFVMAALLIIIIAATTAGAMITRLTTSFPLSAESSFVIGILVSVVAAFLLFSVIYLVFPNVEPRLRPANIWKGSVVAAVAFTIFSTAWPIYTHFAHFSKYGAVLFPILVLTAWLYFFSLIVCIGAELVAMGVISEAESKGVSVGPEPTNSVPQHRVLRSVANVKDQSRPARSTEKVPTA
jgi:YihY family inner membrane protein